MSDGITTKHPVNSWQRCQPPHSAPAQEAVLWTCQPVTSGRSRGGVVIRASTTRRERDDAQFASGSLSFRARSPSLIRNSATVCSTPNHLFLASAASAGRATDEPAPVFKWRATLTAFS